ncbi:HAD family hydrolase [bacterium]|nr:HAD family hydrolase [bacterium]
MKDPFENITGQRQIVCFDLGGTLVEESAPQLHPIPEHIIAQIGLDDKTLSNCLLSVMDLLMKENARKAEDQIPAQKIIEDWLEKSPFNMTVKMLENAAWHMLGANATTYLKPLPFAETLLRKLKDTGTTIVALSNTALPLSILEKIMDVHQLNSYFDAIILSSECGFRKPSPKVFEKMEHSIGYTPEDIMLFIGNNIEADIAPAISRGYMTGYISQTNDNYEEANFKPTFFAKTLKALYQQICNERTPGRMPQ